jgi:hypothetical protein
MRGDCTGTVVAARIPPSARFARESRAFLLGSVRRDNQREQNGEDEDEDVRRGGHREP